MDLEIHVKSIKTYNYDLKIFTWCRDTPRHFRVQTLETFPSFQVDSPKTPVGPRPKGGLESLYLYGDVCVTLQEIKTPYGHHSTSMVVCV